MPVYTMAETGNKQKMKNIHRTVYSVKYNIRNSNPCGLNSRNYKMSSYYGNKICAYYLPSQL